MADREVVIKISAKNLTEAEFKKVKKGLGGIGSSADGAKGKVSGLERGFQSLKTSAPGALKIVAGAAIAVGAAVLGIGAAIIKLGEHGAGIDDIRTSFDQLATAAGSTGTAIITELKAGVKGTVTELDLMKDANKLLGTGMLETEEDARVLAEGARLLGKRTGVDTVTAFKNLTTAIAGGRVTQLKQLGLFIDNKKAVEDFARAEGVSVGDLTDYGRAVALQKATMEALRGELEKSPAPLKDFGELILAGKTVVKDLVAEIAVAISQSQPLLEGMRSAGEGIAKAFGNDKKELVSGVVTAIEDAAIISLEFGKQVINSALVISQGFGVVKSIVLGVRLAFSEMNTEIAESTAKALEVATVMSGYDETLARATLTAREAAVDSAAYTATLKEQIVDSVAAAQGNDEMGVSLQGYGIVLGEAQLEIVKARQAQEELNTKAKDGKTDMVNLDTAVGGVKSKLETVIPTMGLTRDEVVLIGDDTVVMADILDEKFGEIMDGQLIVQSTFAATGVQIGGTAAVVQAAFKRMGIATRAELEATAKQAKEDYETIKSDGESSADAVQKAWEESEEAQRTARGQTEEFSATSNQNISESMTKILGEMGRRGKAAAIAAAVIGTAVAVVQALRSSPPPGSWILAATNAALGAIQIATIKSQSSNRTGTDRLDFEDFGVSRPAVLHGREAVIPQGGGHMLAREIAGELGGRQRPDDAQLSELREIRSSLAELGDLPRAIQRAVRDGMLLAG